MTEKTILTQDDAIDVSLAKQAINSANDGITIVDMMRPDQPLIFVNQSFERMTGYKRSEVIGKNCRFLQGKSNNQPQLSIIRQAMKSHKSCRVILRNYKKDGTLFWNELSLAPISNNGELAYYVGVQKDVTTEMVQKERIIYLSEHDDLTGLYNYRGFFNKINELVDKLKTTNAMIGIGMADIDYFKELNDHYGHLKANNILKILASEFIQEFSSDDIISRFGGDEFCFAMVVKDDNPDYFYEKIARIVASTNSVLANTFQISISSGIAIDKVTEETRIERLIHQADTIMYENKHVAHLNQLKKNT